MQQSAKLAQEEAAKRERAEDVQPIKAAVKIEKYKIKPIECFNEWVMVLPFPPAGTIKFVEGQGHRQVGLVIGRSETVMAPNGTMVPSRFQIGDAVMYTRQSSEVKVNEEPYITEDGTPMPLFIVSERNIVFRLASVEYERVEGKIKQESVMH